MGRIPGKLGLDDRDIPVLAQPVRAGQPPCCLARSKIRAGGICPRLQGIGKTGMRTPHMPSVSSKLLGNCGQVLDPLWASHPTTYSWSERAGQAWWP